MMVLTGLTSSVVCDDVQPRAVSVTTTQSDILEGIKKDNYELTDDMQQKLASVCDEFTTSFTG